MIFWGVWFLVENSAQLWSTSPKKKATQQFRGSLPPSCCAEEKTAENARSFQQQWGGTSRRNFRAISSNHPRANVFPLLDMETCKLGRGYVGLQDGMLFMRYKQEIEYNICNYKYYIYIYILPQIINTLNGDKRLQPSLHFGFPRLSVWYVIDVNRTSTADVDDLHIWNQVQSHRRSWMVKRSSPVQ